MDKILKWGLPLVLLVYGFGWIAGFDIMTGTLDNNLALVGGGYFLKGLF